jgi:hypothetical protein
MLTTPRARAFLLGCIAVFAPPIAKAGGIGSVTGGYSVEYTGYSHGFTVLKLAGSLNLSNTGYGAHVTFHTAGMASWMVRSENDSTVRGTFNGLHAVPVLFEGSGFFRGSNRVTEVAYEHGSPVVRRLVPPFEPNRAPVPPGDVTGTIDTLSAVVMLIHAVATDGRCDGTVNTFDGRRLARQTSVTFGQDTLTRVNHSMYDGPALRCDFVGQQLAGFVTNEDQAALRKPRKGSAWLAPILPGAPPVPVRVMFDNNLLGEVTLYLTAVSKE